MQYAQCFFKPRWCLSRIPLRRDWAAKPCKQQVIVSLAVGQDRTHADVKRRMLVHCVSMCLWLLAGAANGSASPDVVPKGHGTEQANAVATNTESAAGSSSDVSPAASVVELTHMEGASADIPQATSDAEAGLLSAAPAEAAGGRDDGCAVVLTTHSMEEVEVLCSRVGIMHRGRLACLGSPQRLKALYGGVRNCSPSPTS